MKELESEIKRYKADNKLLKEKSLLVEKERVALETDRHNFEELQHKEQVALEAAEAEMARKLKSERRSIERQVKARAMHPDRKYGKKILQTHQKIMFILYRDRTEMDALKAEVAKLKVTDYVPTIFKTVKSFDEILVDGGKRTEWET